MKRSISNNINKVNKPLTEYPEIKPLILDTIEFIQKWNVETISNALGVSRQSLYEQLEKRKERHETK